MTQESAGVMAVVVQAFIEQKTTQGLVAKASSRVSRGRNGHWEASKGNTNAVSDVAILELVPKVGLSLWGDVQGMVGAL